MKVLGRVECLVLGLGWALLVGCGSRTKAQEASHLPVPSRIEAPASPPPVRAQPAKSAPTDPSAVESPAYAWTPGGAERIEWREGLVNAARVKESGRVILGSKGAQAGLALLDDERPRPLPPTGLPLNALLPEDEEPAPGSHRLVGCTRELDGFTCEALTVHLDARRSVTSVEPNREPVCVLLEPGGTYWASSPIPLLVLGPRDGGGSTNSFPEVEILGRSGSKPSRSSSPLRTQWGRRDSLELRAGDYEVRVTCGDQPTISRIITVNTEEPPR